MRLPQATAGLPAIPLRGIFFFGRLWILLAWPTLTGVRLTGENKTHSTEVLFINTHYATRHLVASGTHLPECKDRVRKDYS